jgi:hypothetical protein
MVWMPRAIRRVRNPNSVEHHGRHQTARRILAFRQWRKHERYHSLTVLLSDGVARFCLVCGQSHQPPQLGGGLRHFLGARFVSLDFNLIVDLMDDGV